MSVVPAQAAPGDVVLANGCTVVANPTETTFTSCPGADFTGLEAALAGLDFSYAKLAGATFGGTFNAGLQEMDFVNADLTNVRFTVTGYSELDLTGATLNGALIPSSGAYLTAPGLDFSVLSPDQFAAGRDLNMYFPRINGFTAKNMTVDGNIYLMTPEVEGFDISGSTFNGSFGIPFSSLANNSKAVGTTFNGNANFMESFLEDSDFSNAKFLGEETSMGGVHADRSNFSGVLFAGEKVLMGGFHGNNLDFSNGVMDAGSANRNDFSWAGSFFSNADFSNSQFLGTKPIDFGGNEMNYVDFSGATFANPEMSLNGVVALKANFQNTKFTAPLTARGMWLTSTVWTGATFDKADPDSDYPNFTGSIFAFVNMAGVTFPVSGGGVYFSDSNFEGSTLIFSTSSEGNVFHRTNLKNATLNAAGYPLNGAQFRDANLDGITINAQSINGVSIVDSSMVGGTLNVTTLSGLVAANSDFTDVTFPAAHNSTSDPLKWLYAQMWIDTELKGSSVAPNDVTGVSLDGAPVAVDFSAGSAWDNTDGQDPFNADGSYWWGSGLECNVSNGSKFPVGRTTVICKATFQHAGKNIGVWDSTDFSWTKPAGGGRSDMFVSGVGDAPEEDPFTANQVWPTDTMVPSAYTKYVYGDLFQAGWYNADQIKVSSLPMTFNVDVNQSPTTDAQDYVGLLGDPININASSVGFPNPTVVVTGLPTGVTYTTEVTGKLTDVVLHGTPTVAGLYPVTVTGTNSVGTTSKTVNVNLFDPNAQAVPNKIKPGGFTVVTGYGFHPSTEATLFEEDGTPVDVDPTTTSVLGVATFSDVVLTTEGTFRFLIKGGGGLEALSNEVVVGDLVDPPADILVTPIAPTLVASNVCGVESTISVPNVTGVLYTSFRTGSVINVTASALAGHAFTTGAVTEWSLTLPTVVTCPVDPPVIPEPPVDPPITPEEPVIPVEPIVPSPAAPAPPAIVSPPATIPELAVTGASGMLMAAAFSVMLLMGGGAVVSLVRRRETSK